MCVYNYPFTFGRSEDTLEDSKYVVLGVPFDSSESYRPGSRFAPNAIREASREIEGYDLLEDFEFSKIGISDAGDLEVSYGDVKETQKRINYTVKEILEGGRIPIILGGEHTVSYFTYKAYKEKPLMVIFDAHLDFRKEYLGNNLSHACVSRRVGELGGFGNLLIIGVRSGSKEDIEDARRLGVDFIDINSCKNIKRVKERLIEKTEGKEIFLSIDADVLDPKEAPGVCNPEPPGFTFTEMVELFDFLKFCKLRGLDLVEVSPLYDSYTPVLAAKLIFKALIKSEMGSRN